MLPRDAFCCLSAPPDQNPSQKKARSRSRWTGAGFYILLMFSKNAKWRESGAYTPYVGRGLGWRPSVSAMSRFAIHRYTLRSMKGAVDGQHRQGPLDFFEMISNTMLCGEKDPR